MYALRVLLWKICFPIMTLGWSALIILTSYFMEKKKHLAFSSHWGDSVFWLARWLLGIRHEVHGLEHLPANPGYIIAANHQSSWETAYLPTITRNYVWVLKWELTQIPVFGRALRRLDSIAIHREEGREALKQLQEEGGRFLAAGRNVLIFPEGTRQALVEPQKFKAGAALLARANGVAIVPVAHNAGQFWSHDGKDFHPGTIQVVIGPPISSEGKSTSQINAELEEWLCTTRDRLMADERARRGN